MTATHNWHACDDVRDAFSEAVSDYCEGDLRWCLPMGDSHLQTIATLRRCSDILPSDVHSQASEITEAFDATPMKSNTYAGAAKAILAIFK